MDKTMGFCLLKDDLFDNGFVIKISLASRQRWDFDVAHEQRANAETF
jgi:hypothetical protein